MTFFSNLSSLFTKARESTQTPPKKPSQAKPKTQTKTTHQKHQAPKKSNQKRYQKPINTVQLKPKVDAIVREAQAQAREIVVEAKDKALQIKSGAERKARTQENELNQKERTLDHKVNTLDRRLDILQTKEKNLDNKKQEVTALKEKMSKTTQKMLKRLEELSGLTKQEAKNVLMDGLEKKISQDMAKLVREKEETAQQEAKDKAKEILIDAMKHGATDYVAEYTVSTIKISSDDIKGKIIGKSGRNIHAFERLTGVDLDLDYSDTEVRLSCFDSVRREIARIALERLIKDGRIQPVRIEKTVAKVKEETEQFMFDAGKDLCQRVGVYNLPNDLIRTLGRFKYRFSYGQNMITHTLEETKIGIKIAHELNLDVNTVKLGCLLHDVGKTSDNPDGNHVEIGVKIAKKYNMPKEVVECIAQHHEDEPFTGPEQMAVYIADAISGARPGARYENMEGYIERLENLEQIATSYSEVAEAYAVQAGREIRVLLNPEKSKDDDVIVLANKIKDKIEEKLTFPGTVTINVIREYRGQATAK